MVRRCSACSLVAVADCLSLVSGLLHMTEEDITEKPDSENLNAAISRLREYREALQLNYDGVRSLPYMSMVFLVIP